MPVTIVTCDLEPEPWPARKRLVADPKELLRVASRDDAYQCGNVISSSFSSSSVPPEGIVPSKNGLVEAATHAWNHHNNLVLRPDDFWMAILSQLNFYINKHAERLRDFFVSHQGTKTLEVFQAATIKSADYALFAELMADAIGNNVKDPELKDWIMPNFSTTTDEDRTTAAVLFMGALQKYFEYSLTCVSCGIPRVTLLGEKEDWISLQRRVDKILPWGPEAERYREDLAPIFKYILASFDDPTSDQVSGFWAKMVSKYGPAEISLGTDPYITGWLTGLFLWDDEGDIRSEIGSMDNPYSSHEPCVIDDVKYAYLNLGKPLIPTVASVPVTLSQVDGCGKVIRKLNTVMAAGCGGYMPCLVEEGPVPEKTTKNQLEPSDGSFEDPAERYSMFHSKPYCLVSRDRSDQKSLPSSEGAANVTSSSGNVDSGSTYIRPVNFW